MTDTILKKKSTISFHEAKCRIIAFCKSLPKIIDGDNEDLFGSCNIVFREGKYNHAEYYGTKK
jgi:hypothetical protein